MPTAEAARDIGEAILRNRQSAEARALFELRVQPVGNDAWDVTESIPPRRGADGSVTVTDGGGMAIRIDRCDGRVRFILYVI